MKIRCVLEDDAATELGTDGACGLAQLVHGLGLEIFATDDAKIDMGLLGANGGDLDAAGSYVCR